MKEGKRRTLLMLCHDFPPVMAGGVVRPLKFAKYLPGLGWDVVVVTSADSAPSAVDESFLREIFPDVEVIRTKPYLPSWLLRRVRRHEQASLGQGSARGGASFSRAVFGRLLNAIRLHVLVPDRQLLWKRRAIRSARGVLARRRIDALYTTSPPQSVHLIGLEIKKQLGLPWVADFRDHWMDEEFYPFLRHPHRRAREQTMESEVVRHADAVLSVTDAAREDFLKRYPEHREKFLLLPNGFDEEDFSDGTDVPPDRKAFRVRSFGSVGKGRDPAVLLDALRALRGTDVHEDIRVEFFGHFGYPRAPWKEELGDRVLFVDSIPHAEVAREMRRAALLVAVQSAASSAAFAVPGKLYEYSGAGVPVLGIMDEGPAADLIRRHRLGWVCHPGDAETVAGALREAHARWKRGTQNDPNPEFTATFSRARLACDLAKVLNAAAR